MALKTCKERSNRLGIASLLISSATFALSLVWYPYTTRRAEQAKLAFDIKRQYVQDYQPHLDTLHAYKAKHGKDYYKHWQENMKDGLPSNEEKMVDNARRLVREFWGEVFDYREYGSLAKGWKGLPAPLAAWGPRDALSGNFVRKAVDFQKLVEPLDVANWYRLQANNPNAFVGDYLAEDCKGRDKCYKGIDNCRKQEGMDGGYGEPAEAWKKKLQTVAQGCKAPQKP